MNLLQKMWRGLKKLTGKTDAELAFSAVVANLSAKDRNELRGKLEAVQFVCEIAALSGNSDPKVQEAQDWANGAIKVIDEE